MTKKDYIRLAEAFRSTQPPRHEVAAWEQWERTLEAVSGELRADNSRFSAETFRAACLGDVPDQPETEEI